MFDFGRRDFFGVFAAPLFRRMKPPVPMAGSISVTISGDVSAFNRDVQTLQKILGIENGDMLADLQYPERPLV